MEKRERVKAAISGAAVDRPPFVLWHHFRPAGSPEALARATVDFFGDLDLDIVKVMPDLPYPAQSDVLRGVEGWRNLEHLDARTGALRGIPESAALVRKARPDDVILVTVFSPLATAIKFAGGHSQLIAHLKQDRAAVLRGLEVITENLVGLASEALARGADGIYFATNGQGEGLFSAEEYSALGRPFDLQVLDAAGAGWVNVLHMHGATDLHWEWTRDYPVAVFSWSDRRAGIPLADLAAKLPGKAVMGGIDEFGAIVDGDMAKVAEEMRDAVAQMAGRRLILAGGCSVPDDIALDHLTRARALAEELSA